jgi:hypothetical protein
MMPSATSPALSHSLCVVGSSVPLVLLAATFGQRFRLLFVPRNFDSALLASTFGLLSRNFYPVLPTLLIRLNACSFFLNASG